MSKRRALEDRPIDGIGTISRPIIFVEDVTFEFPSEFEDPVVFKDVVTFESGVAISGGQFEDPVTFAGQATYTSGEQSFNELTGAIVVTGGIGVGGNVSIANNNKLLIRGPSRTDVRLWGFDIADDAYDATIAALIPGPSVFGAMLEGAPSGNLVFGCIGNTASDSFSWIHTSTHDIDGDYSNGQLLMYLDPSGLHLNVPLVGAETGDVHYITDISQIPTNGGSTARVLTPGRWILRTDVGGSILLDLPFELPDSGTVEIQGNIVFVGSGTVFASSTLGSGTSNPILILRNFLLTSPPPTPANQLFDLAYDGVSVFRPVLIIDFAQFLFLSSVGTVTNFDTIVVKDYSSRFNTGGFIMDNTLNQISVNTTNFQDDISGHNFMYFDGTTNLSPGIQLSGINYKPSNTSSRAVYIDDVLTPNASITGCVYDPSVVSDSEFFNPNGLDQDSVYVIAKSMKNVFDSRASIFDHSNVTTAVVKGVNSQNQKRHMTGIGTHTVDQAKRISASSNRIYTYEGTESVTLHITLVTSYRAATGVPTFGVSIGWIEPSQEATSNSATNNFFVSGGHGYQTDEEISFLAGGPGGPHIHLYFVERIDSLVFRIKDSPGGPIVPVVTGTWTVSRVTQVGIENDLTVDTTYFLTSVVSVLVDAQPGYRYGAFFRNTTGTESMALIGYSAIVVD